MNLLSQEKDKKKIENNIIKDVKNLFSLQKEIDDNTTKNVINLFRLKREHESIKNKMIRYIISSFELENEEKDF